MYCSFHKRRARKFSPNVSVDIQETLQHEHIAHACRDMLVYSLLCCVMHEPKDLIFLSQICWQKIKSREYKTANEKGTLWFA